MSRSVGLREDQREGRVLATLIAGLFALDPLWCHCEQARPHMGPQSKVGASLLAKRPEQPAKF
ncbi:hypothetical protein D3C76_1763180 [compost metagenome]|jgi:hypothetical protein|uniref:Uncharacterized protein n=1 Tax=Pseudomonas fluorescens TaxID=294 RepID=A0A5E7KVE8_PSEFL|nr:hypothetical protein PspS34_26265 [Pseudomonas sp. S34]VVM73640.1 hypothetical protein PS673_01910 [Pseudomonas fluorescens]VVP03637.1 hypothetical protein PS893_02957 [Pseudomonas fluorescens]